jgi:hypothetical protein
VRNYEPAQQKEELHARMAKSKDIAEWDVTQVLWQRKAARGVVQDDHNSRDPASSLNSDQLFATPQPPRRRRVGHSLIFLDRQRCFAHIRSHAQITIHRCSIIEIRD